MDRESFNAYLAANDHALLIFTVVTLVIFAMGVWLWPRIEIFRGGVRAVAGLIVPVMTMTISPIVGLWSAVVPYALNALPLHIIPTRLMLFIIVAVGALLRVPRLFESMWYDEAWTATLIQMDFPRWAEIILNDVHPPLFYLLNEPLVMVSTSAAWLRLLPFAFGLLSIWLMYRLTLWFSDHRVALIAATITAVLPSAIYYSTELRAYSLLSCLVMVMLIAILNDRPSLFAFAAAAMMWTHNIGFIYAPVLAIFGILTNMRRWPRKWFLWSALAGIIGALWVPFLWYQMTNVRTGFWIPPFNLGQAFWPVVTMTVGKPVEGFEFLIFPALLIVFGAIYHTRHWAADYLQRNIFAAIFGVPAVVAVVSLLVTPIYVDRYLYPSALLLVIPVAYMLAYSSESRLLRRVVIGLGVVTLIANYGNPRPAFQQYLSDYCPDAQAVYHTSLFSMVAIGAQWDGPELAWPDSTDTTNTYDKTLIPLFGQLGDIEAFRGEKVCVVFYDVAVTTPNERHFINQLAEQYDHTMTRIHWSPTDDLVIYLFEVT